jgi:hypothetical protein
MKTRPVPLSSSSSKFVETGEIDVGTQDEIISCSHQPKAVFLSGLVVTHVWTVLCEGVFRIESLK